MAWSQTVKGFLFLNSTGYVSPLPTNCAEFLNNDTYPQTKTIGGENITVGLTSVATSGRDRNASYGKLAGFHFAEQAGSGTRVYRFDIPAGTYRIRLAQTDPDNIQTGNQILVKDGGGSTLVTLTASATLNLVRDIDGTIHTSRANWASSNTTEDITVSSTYITLECSYNAAHDYFLSYFEIEQLTQAPIIPTIYVNGVGDEVNVETGDGTAFKNVVNAASNDDDIRIDTSIIDTITLSAKYTLPATRLTIGTRGIDSIHAVGTPITAAKIPQILTIASSGAGSSPIMDCAKGSLGIRWEGVAFDYADRTGNNAIVTSPQDTLSYDSAAQDAYLITDQPDNWYFDRCVFKEKSFFTSSFRFLIHNGKRITFSDMLVQTMMGTGEDGYWAAGDVGDGPWLTQRVNVEDVHGESQGFGTHGQRSGAGADGSGDPGYQNFADNNLQPLEEGYTMSSCRIVRDTTKRRSCWSGTSFTPGTGTKAFTVPVGMPFTNGEPVTASAGYTAGTSTTSLTIGTGTKSFTTQTAKDWDVGATVQIFSTASSADSMTGTISAYNSGTGAMDVSVTSVTGSGTFASWSVLVHNFMSGTVTSYSGTTLTLNVTTENGGGTYADWVVSRTDVQRSYKNMMEWTYGQDCVVEGVLFQNFWQDFNTQNYLVNIKLSTQNLTALDHVAMRRVTFRYCVFLSLAQLYSIAEYVALDANPAMTDFVLEHCAVLDVDIYKYGGPGQGGLIYLGTDMPANVQFSHTIFHAKTAFPSGYLMQFGDAGSGHASITNFTGHSWTSNIIAANGDEPYEIRGYYGTGPTLASNPKEYLDNACTSPTFTHNSVVTADPTTNWASGTRHASNTWYTGTSGRTALLAKFRNPTASSPTDLDFRYIAGQEESGHDGVTRGPNWSAMYDAMGWAWPFSWTPESSSGGRRARRVFFIRSGPRFRVRRRRR